MTAGTDSIVWRSATRIDLINALRDIEPGGRTKLTSLAILADLILDRLPGEPQP